MTNQRISIVFREPDWHATRVLESDEYRSVIYLDAGAEIVLSNGQTVFHPWGTIHEIRKFPSSREGEMYDEAIVASDGQVLDMVKPEL